MRRTMHMLKLFSSIAVTSLALSVFLASAAQAGHTWEVNGALMAAGSTKTCQGTSDGTLTVKSSVLKQPFHLTATNIVTEGCTITQTGSGATAAAEGTIKKFGISGLTTHQPSECKVSSPINFNPVKTKVITIGSPAVAYTTIGVESGTEFATLVISGCAAAESYPLRGSVCAEMPQAGVFNVQQTFKFSEVADKACPTDIFTVGAEPAIIRGAFTIELTGADAGKAWGFTTT